MTFHTAVVKTDHLSQPGGECKHEGVTISIKTSTCKFPPPPPPLFLFLFQRGGEGVSCIKIPVSSIPQRGLSQAGLGWVTDSTKELVDQLKNRG